MHLTALLVLFLLAALSAGLCLAEGLADEIFLSSKDNITAVSGEVSGRATRSYRLRITAKQVITFVVDADNAACGSEIKKTSQLGLLTVMDRFPASFSDRAKFGDEYAISFFQSRLGRMDGAVCKFSFSVSLSAQVGVRNGDAILHKLRGKYHGIGRSDARGATRGPHVFL